MALWGNSDNVTSTGTVTLNYSTGQVVGAGTSFATDLKVGQVIRFGIRGGTGIYHGDAVIVGITSEKVLSIGSTAGLSGVAIASTDFTVSELPKYTVLDSKFSEASYGTEDSLVYGISTGAYNGYGSTTSSYRLDGEGWVGVTTYVDTHGNLRVKKEILVAMSGITTFSVDYPTPV